MATPSTSAAACCPATRTAKCGAMGRALVGGEASPHCRVAQPALKVLLMPASTCLQLSFHTAAAACYPLLQELPHALPGKALPAAPGPAVLRPTVPAPVLPHAAHAAAGKPPGSAAKGPGKLRVECRLPRSRPGDVRLQRLLTQVPIDSTVLAFTPFPRRFSAIDFPPHR